MSKVELCISKSCYFNNGDLLISSIKDLSGECIEDKVKKWLNQTYELKVTEHHEKARGKWNGYNADDLNNALREKISEISGVHSESYVENGAFVKAGKKGFDFVVLDEDYNIKKLINSYIGNPGIYNGEKLLKNKHDKIILPGDKKIKKREWEKMLSVYDSDKGKNIISAKKHYTIVGEIQFGNWALAEHDLLRLLNSSIDGEIDFYIYITATGELEKKLSTAIVTYDKVIKLYEENRQLLHTPVWLIGIDEANS